MVAFVMAYSFTEPQDKNQSDVSSDDDDDDSTLLVSAPMMVPVADMLNHVTRNNAKLTFGKEALKMVTTRPVKKVDMCFFFLLFCFFFLFHSVFALKKKKKER